MQYGGRMRPGLLLDPPLSSVIPSPPIVDDEEEIAEYDIDVDVDVDSSAAPKVGLVELDCTIDIGLGLAKPGGNEEDADEAAVCLPRKNLSMVEASWPSKPPSLSFLLLLLLLVILLLLLLLILLL